MTATEWTADSAGSGRYADVNGINLYYATYGAGHPMVLLHGGLGSGEMFEPILPTLADRHQVILVDMQGHGRTGDIDRPLDVRLMADDVAALIEHLGLQKPDVVGYSLGGGVALQVAIRHPETVGRLVSASANIRRDAVYPQILQQQGQMSSAAAEFMKDTPDVRALPAGGAASDRTGPAPPGPGTIQPRARPRRPAAGRPATRSPRCRPAQRGFERGATHQRGFAAGEELREAVAVAGDERRVGGQRRPAAGRGRIAVVA